MAVNGTLTKANADALYDLITNCTSLTNTTLSASDYIGIADVDASTGKKITVNNLLKAIKNDYSLGQTITLDGKQWIVVHLMNGKQDVILMEKYAHSTTNTMNRVLNDFDETLSNNFKKELIHHDYNYSFYLTASNCLGYFTSVQGQGSNVIVISYINYGPFGNLIFDYLQQQNNRKATMPSGSTATYFLYTSISRDGGTSEWTYINETGAVCRLVSQSNINSARLCVHYNNRLV